MKHRAWTACATRQGAGGSRRTVAASSLLLVGLALAGPCASAQPAPSATSAAADPPPSIARPPAATEPPAAIARPPDPTAASELPAAPDPSQGAVTQSPSRITAVWKERRLSFNYSSTSTIYSCNAMESRVASVLRAVGARDDVKVRVNGCNISPSSDPRMSVPVGSRGTVSMDPTYDRYRSQGSAANPRQFATVYVTAMLPAEVSDDVYAELEKDKSRRELVARATGNAAARFNDPILFAAQRQRVTLSYDTIGIEVEECELLDQLTSMLLPQIGVRVVSRSGTLCPRGSSLPPQVVVDALMPFYGDPSSALPSPPPTGERTPQGREPPTDGEPPSER